MKYEYVVILLLSQLIQSQLYLSQTQAFPKLEDIEKINNRQLSTGLFSINIRCLQSTNNL